jgi:hypothetical protein
MALMFINDVKAEINSQLPDNSTGAITPAILRGVLQDMTDSLYGRGAAILGTHSPAVVLALTAALTKFTTLFLTQINANAAVFTTSIVNGDITTHEGGFFHEFTITAVFDGATNTDVRFALFKNNLQVGGAFGAQTTGAGELVTLQASLAQTGVVDGDVFDVRVASVPNANINFHNFVLNALLQPTTSAL